MLGASCTQGPEKTEVKGILDSSKLTILSCNLTPLDQADLGGFD